MNTKVKEALRKIRKEKVSFLSIVVIMMIAVSNYLGISFGANAIYERTDRFYKDLSFRDLELTSTLLVNPNDVDDIKKIEGIKDAEEVYFIPARTSMKGGNASLNVVSLTERINTNELIEGRLPQDSSECALEESLAQKLELNVGDKITIVDAEDKCPEYLLDNVYTITGLVLVADHYAYEHVVPQDLYMMVTPDAFSSEALDDCCMRIIMSIDKPEGMSYFSDEYRKMVEDVKERVDVWTKVHEKIRTDDIHTKTDEKLQEAWQTLVDSKKSLDENSKKLEDGRRELADAKGKLEEASGKIEDGAKLLSEKKIELDDAKKKLDDADAKLASGKKTLDENKKKLDTADKELSDAEDKLDKAADQLVKGYNEAEAIKDTVRETIRNKVNDKVPQEYADTIDWGKSRYITKSDLEDDSLDITKFKITSDIIIDLTADAPLAPEPVLKKLLKGTDYEPMAGAIVAAIRDTKEYKDANKELKGLKKDLKNWDKGLDEYREGLSAVKEGRKEYKAGLTEYEKGEKQYKEGLEEYKSGKALYDEGLKAYEDGKNELEQASKDYKAGLASYEDNKKKLDDAEKKLVEGEQLYSDGMESYKEGKKKYEELGSCYYVVLDIKGNPAFVHAANCADNVTKISVTFASLFIVLGFLVIYATVGRIVTEDRRLIGTQKALGFFVREVLMKYLIFGCGSTLLGSILGVIGGYLGLQTVIIIAHAQFYVVKDFPKTVSWWLIVIVVLAAVLMSAISVTFACTSLLKESSRELLTDPVPRAVKRKGKNKGGSLYGRLIFRNILTDLPRVLITMVSVAGCCILLVIGFTLKDSIMNAIRRQSNHIMTHDIRVLFDNEISKDAGDTIEGILKENNIEHTEIYLTILMFDTVQGLTSSEFIVTDKDEIDNYFTFWDVKGKEHISIDDDGLYLSMKTKEAYQLSVGDEITIYDSRMDPYKARVAGFFEYYCGKEIFATFEGYKKIFGKDIEPNQYWTNTDLTEGEMESLVSQVKGYKSIKTTESIRKLYEDSMSALSIVTVVMGIAAAMMAYFVLLNLTNMYLNRKKKELVVMRINGFTVKEVIRYVAMESIFTTLGGILMGLVFGSILGDWIVRSIEQPQICFFHQIDFPGWIWSAIITLIYAVGINFLALRKVPNYKLYDMNS